MGFGHAVGKGVGVIGVSAVGVYTRKLWTDHDGHTLEAEPKAVENGECCHLSPHTGCRMLSNLTGMPHTPQSIHYIRDTAPSVERYGTEQQFVPECTGKPTDKFIAPRIDDNEALLGRYASKCEQGRY